MSDLVVMVILAMILVIMFMVPGTMVIVLVTMLKIW